MGVDEVVGCSATGEGTTGSGEEVGTGDGAAGDGSGDGAGEGTTGASAATTSAAGAEESSALAQPVFAVRAAGQVTCLNDTLGLSAPLNQS